MGKMVTEIKKYKCHKCGGELVYLGVPSAFQQIFPRFTKGKNLWHCVECKRKFEKVNKGEKKNK